MRSADQAGCAAVGGVKSVSTQCSHRCPAASTAATSAAATVNPDGSAGGRAATDEETR